MQNTNDGGPAFPRPAAFGRRPAKIGGREELVESQGQSGMSLRDYFAAAALPSALGAFYGPDSDAWDDHDDLAAHVWRVADAMLRAREAK